MKQLMGLMMKFRLVLILLCFFSVAVYADPAPASEVFQIHTKKIDPNTFVIDWTLKPGYFIYGDRIKINEPKDSNAQLNVIQFPRAEKKTDQLGQVFSIYRKKLSLPVAVLGTQAGESLITLHYQGCSDEGFCYPPETRQIKLAINENNELTDASLEPPSKLNPTHTPAELTKEEAVFSHGWVIMILSFFGFGLLLAFTPCVLPMVPVLSGIIIGQGHRISTRKAFFLSLSYVFSMAATYAFVGAVIAWFGSNLQIVMQSPYAITLFSLMFVILAFSMFGLYELRLPTAWQAKLTRISRSQHGGEYLGAAVMGCLSTLILSPCVTAPLIGALSYIAHTGNIILGSVALFVLGLGMGTPLLLMGTSAGKLLPKAGAWMESVKFLFGFLLLAVAIDLIGRILPQLIIMLLWSSLFIFSAVHFGVFNLSSRNRLNQSMSIFFLIYGLLILIGAGLGNSNPLLPLSSLASSKVEITAQNKQTIKTLSELKQALKQSKGKPIIVDFYADWCNSCKVMAKTTFKNPIIIEALKPFLIIEANVTANDQTDKALLKQYQVIAPPTFLFFDKEGNELKQMRLVGEISTTSFLKQLEALKHQLNLKK